MTWMIEHVFIFFHQLGIFHHCEVLFHPNQKGCFFGKELIFHYASNKPLLKLCNFMRVQSGIRKLVQKAMIQVQVFLNPLGCLRYLVFTPLHVGRFPYFGCNHHQTQPLVAGKQLQGAIACASELVRRTLTPPAAPCTVLMVGYSCGKALHTTGVR